VPRNARKKSESGIYHIILRGSNRQEIFHDDKDRIKFLETINKYRVKSKLEVYGWCLMGNHVHLLIEEGEEEISVTMKRIGVSYVWYYNFKYKTTGHLFQDRYRSEDVDNDKYLLTVVRYIHQNPIKAGMVRSCIDWKWSSCAGYYGGNCYPPGLLNNNLVLGMISEDKATAFKRFRVFNEMGNDDKCLEDNVISRLTDEEAKEKIQKLKLEYDITEVKALPKNKRDDVIKRIKSIEGLTQRQAARILGVSPNIIFKT
jgi:REP element-mobilizing transposase RayT